MVCSNKYCSFDHDLSSNPNLIGRNRTKLTLFLVVVQYTHYMQYLLTTPHSHSTYVHDIICT
uniref:Uncharacterized protein n=1 Tax=Rhizophagus irregularis (strain DAOM 181602 / DAOM 197198 / MUCL 43194) TaxID=747089 RepID=U9U6P2_RHIID